MARGTSADVTRHARPRGRAARAHAARRCAQVALLSSIPSLPPNSLFLLHFNLSFYRPFFRLFRNRDFSLSCIFFSLSPSLPHFVGNLSLQFSSNLRPGLPLIFSLTIISFFLLSPHVLTSSLSPASFLRIFCHIPFLALFSSVTYRSHNLSLSSSLSSPLSLSIAFLFLYSLSLSH